MNEASDDRVSLVIRAGLDLQARLRRGEQPVLETEQAALKGWLLSTLEARRWIEYGGETELDVLRGDDSGRAEAHPGGGLFLGTRYALVCWLDELFILDSPWEAVWNEKKLEAALYGTNDRAWKFWEQARLAELRPGTDALRAFFLCVMFGFRGELREQPDRLREWVTAIRLRIVQTQAPQWPAPAALEPRTDVPPRYGRARLQRLVRIGSVVLLLLVPLLTFLVVQRIGH